MPGAPTLEPHMRWIKRLLPLEYQILLNQEQLMQQFDDLKAAVTALTTAVDALLAKYSTNTVPPAEVQTLVDETNALTTKINAVP